MAIIKIQLRKEVRRYVDVNVQLNRIYNFIFKKFEDVPSYFELQYRHPMTKIRRQLSDNEQLTALLQLKQSSITLLIRPITFENISRYQISRNMSSGALEICNLFENLSLHQNNPKPMLSHAQSSQQSHSQTPIYDDYEEYSQYNSKTQILQDNQDFLIKDETHEYIDQMYAISDDSSPQIEISFD